MPNEVCLFESHKSLIHVLLIPCLIHKIFPNENSPDKTDIWVNRVLLLLDESREEEALAGKTLLWVKSFLASKMKYGAKLKLRGYAPSVVPVVHHA